MKYKKELNDRTVLVSINGTLGNVGFYNNEAVMLGKSACYFNLFQDISKSYVRTIIQSPYFRDYALSVATGSTIKNLGLKAMNNFVLGVPPLQEQNQIVDKVHELMDVCEHLKFRLKDSQITQLHLTDTIVGLAL